MEGPALAPGADQLREGVAGRQVDGLEPRAEGPVPLRLLYLVQGLAHRPGGDVDHGGQGAERVERRPHQALHVPGVGGVRAQGHGPPPGALDGPGHAAGPVFVQVADGDGRPFAGEALRRWRARFRPPRPR